MATIYWRGRSAYVNWRDADGQHRISLGHVTPREAEAARLEKELELNTGRRIAKRQEAPLFSEFCKDYLKWFEAEYPSSEYRVTKIVNEILLPEFGLRAIDQVTATLVNQWKSGRAQQKSRRPTVGLDDDGKATRAFGTIKTASVNKELRTLKAILNKAVEWEVIDRHPCATVKQIKVLESKPPTFYSLEELRALYEISEARRWWWQLYANTGMRKAEGIQLRRRHIKPDRIQILSTAEERTKSGKWREVPLGDAASEALEALPGADYVLPRMHSNSFTRAYLRDADAAGLNGSMHWLRHTFCSHLVMRGVPLRTVQILAGHANMATTERYAHLAPGHLAGAMKGFSLV